MAGASGERNECICSVQDYLTDEDYCELQWAMMAQPEAGPVIPGSGGVPELRRAAPGCGKRSGYRIFLQGQLANLPGVSVCTLPDWEQGRRAPSGAARTLLLAADRNPKVLLEAS